MGCIQPASSSDTPGFETPRLSALIAAFLPTVQTSKRLAEDVTEFLRGLVELEGSEGLIDDFEEEVRKRTKALDERSEALDEREAELDQDEAKLSTALDGLEAILAEILRAPDARLRSRVEGLSALVRDANRPPDGPDLGRLTHHDYVATYGVS